MCQWRVCTNTFCNLPIRCVLRSYELPSQDKMCYIVCTGCSILWTTLFTLAGLELVKVWPIASAFQRVNHTFCMCVDAVTVVLYNTMISLSEMKAIPVSQVWRVLLKLCICKISVILERSVRFSSVIWLEGIEKSVGSYCQNQIIDLTWKCCCL